MKPQGIVLVIIFVVVVALAIASLLLQRKRKEAPDYYALFIMGIIWLGAGLPLKNYPIWVVGLVFVIVGWVNKDKWHDNRKKWDELNSLEKILKAFLIAILTILLAAGVIIYIFYLR